MTAGVSEPGGADDGDCRQPVLVADITYILGGHLKTGHRGSLQNRPTAAARTEVVVPRWWSPRQEVFDLCSHGSASRLYCIAWAEDSGNAGMRPERRPGPERRGRRPAPKLAILARSDKSQGFGDRVPKVSSLISAPHRSVCQRSLRIAGSRSGRHLGAPTSWPHLSTWP